MSHTKLSSPSDGAAHIPEEAALEPAPEHSEGEREGAGRAQGLRTVAVCAGAALAVVGLAITCASAMLGLSGTDASGPLVSPTPPSQQGQDPSSTAGTENGHEHIWIPAYGIEHREAVTEPRDVDPVYGTETTSHTICNDCLAIIDGAAQEHLDETGHSGFTPDVPVTDEVLVEAGRTDLVVVEEAASELVVTGEKCALCGQERASSEDTED